MDAFIFSWLIAGVTAGVLTRRVLRENREILAYRAVPVRVAAQER